MPFNDFIEKLQNKPRETRIKILWGAVAISMLIILPLWFFSFKRSLSMDNQPKKEDSKELNKLTKSIKEIGKEIPSLKKSLQASISSFFNRTDSQTESPATKTIPKNGAADNLGKEIQPTRLPLSE